MNPSSGNLHPTEAYLILPPLPEDINKGGIFHYNPYLHALEVRAEFDDRLWSEIYEHFGSKGFMVGLSSIYWREAWKYGERAFRYCNHDAGHAMVCLSFSANLLGWKATYLNFLSNEDIEIMLGFQKTGWNVNEKESPDLMLFVHKNKNEPIQKDIPSNIVQSFESLYYDGKPNILSKGHSEWHVIDEVSSLTKKPKTEEMTITYKNHEYIETAIPEKQSVKIIRKRRSAQSFDGKTFISRKDLFAILDKTIPRSQSAPFDLVMNEINIHLLIFIHRINGLEPGLYFLFRNEKDIEDIKRLCHPYFLWKEVKGAPDKLQLYFLQEGDFRADAVLVSCNQDIAGDSAFSLAMIAKFKENIERQPFMYRQLHWEAGMIGQILYIEAEAHDIRGTGIGCFFDDLVHNILGLTDSTYQDLYHFTVGESLEDKRLMTLPPYHHLKR